MSIPIVENRDLFEHFYMRGYSAEGYTYFYKRDRNASPMRFNLNSKRPVRCSQAEYEKAREMAMQQGTYRQGGEVILQWVK